MSTDQLKKTFTSADPRPVTERTFTTPGMSFIASSMGRVTVAIISSPGITPLSIKMTTRGKSACGNTDEDIVSAERTPPRQRQMVTNTIALEWRTTNRLLPDSTWSSVVIGGLEWPQRHQRLRRLTVEVLRQGCLRATRIHFQRRPRRQHAIRLKPGSIHLHARPELSPKKF